MPLSRWLVGLALLPMIGCSSVPILPGDANLATVGYVDTASEENVKSELPGALDTALVNDRKQIAQLQQRVLAQETEIEQSKRELAELSRALDRMSADMQAQAETFRGLADRLHQTADGLDQALVALPQDTLQLFSDALLAHLASRAATPTAPRQEKSSSGPEASPDSAAAGRDAAEGG